MRVDKAFFGLVSVLFLVASCSAGTPSNNTATGGSGSVSCSQGQTSCGTQCVNTATDHANCGMCGKACANSQTCTNGACTCSAGLSACTSGCVNLTSDGTNCGTCGNVCQNGAVCSVGTCTSTCATNLLKCGTSCVNAQTDVTNCGTCGNACTGGRSCNAGACACPSGQTFCNGSCVTGTTCGTGTGGASGTGGATSTGGTTNTGGATTSGGTTNTGGGGGGATSTGGGGTTSTGGGGTTSTGGAGGTTSTGGATVGGGCNATNPDIISDFEEGSALVPPRGTTRNGWWYVYADMQAGTQTPAKATKAVAVELSGGTAMCDKYAFHSTATGHNQYVGFGAAFITDQTGASELKQPFNVSAYDGVSFKIKAGAGTPPALYFEMITKESQPAASGGTATTDTIDLYNTRGQMLNSGTMNIGTSWTTVYVPFATLIPRWVPAVGSGKACPAAGGSVPKCQAIKFVPANALALQFSFYPDPGFPKIGTLGTYDIWVDDVQFYKRSASTPDLPAPPSGGGSKPFPQNMAAMNGCAKPAGPAVDGKFLMPAYNAWKAAFVVAADGGFRVQRPEVNNDTVSEGIAYGMLIAAYMNDKALFDGLYTYWKAHPASSGNALMAWKVPGGNGTATDADEDAAFAMLVASKQWSGGTYAADALKLIQAVYAQDMSSTFIYGGSDYKTNNVTTTNPSYFSPAWYRAFAAVDTTNAAGWNSLATAAYTLLNNIGPTSANGLYAAWCGGSNCSSIATNQGSADPATDVLYQYDSHRIPFRFGLDACWNGNATAKSYLNDKVIKFFANTAGKDGVGRIFDIYTPSNGREATGAAVNSASILGTAAVGAMAGGATYKVFLDDAYQAVFDLVTRAKLAELGDGTKSAYSYYNATVGMLTLLAMTGNMYPP